MQAFRVYYPTRCTSERDGDIPYGLRPPAGGMHRPVWWNCGFYDEPVRDENAVHDLEHGAVWLAYSPDLDEAGRGGDPRDRPRERKVLAAPYEGLDPGVAVVATAWARQLTLDGVDDPRLEAFVEQYQDGDQRPSRRGCTGYAARGPDPVGVRSRPPVRQASSRARSPNTSKRSSTGTRFHAHSSRRRAAASATSPLAWPCSKRPLPARGARATRRRCRWRAGGSCRGRARRSPGARGANSPRCSSTPSTASAGSRAPPRASQRCTAVSWAIRRG